ADIEHALPGLKGELRGDQIELRHLRLFERRLLAAEAAVVWDAREEGAGVGHRGVQEEREELVADVVVVAHGLAIAPGGGRAAAAADGGRRPSAARRRSGGPSRLCPPPAAASR